MHENNNKQELGPSSTDQENSFTVTLESINSAFGISADTLRAMADSYGITPEAMLVRAATTWAQADIPDFDWIRLNSRPPKSSTLTSAVLRTTP